MSALAVGGMVFVCVLGGALLGMFLGGVLPKHHLSGDSKDSIKVAMAMIATLAALVVGLLIASAKSSFDGKDSEMKGAAAHILLLDRTLAEYGPETREIRDLLRQTVAQRISQIWPQESAGTVARAHCAAVQASRRFSASFWIFPRTTMPKLGSRRRR